MRRVLGCCRWADRFNEMALVNRKTYGYQADGSTNGGFAGYQPVRHTDEDDNHNRKPPPQGVAAFSAVIGCGGIPELAWYWSASALELGLFCTDPEQAILLSGATLAKSTPMGPSVHATNAAALQRTIRAALRLVPVTHRTVLEIAYEDRTLPTSLVEQYGHGTAALVQRARDAKASFIAGPEATQIKALGVALRALHAGEKRPKPPRQDWDPMTKSAAQGHLKAAHDAYRMARALLKPQRPKRPPKRYEPRQVITLKNALGTAKRKCYEVA